MAKYSPCSPSFRSSTSCVSFIIDCSCIGFILCVLSLDVTSNALSVFISCLLFGRESHALTTQSDPLLLPTRNGPCREDGALHWEYLFFLKSSAPSTVEIPSFLPQVISVGG